jgi:hypothetical protein
VDKAPHIHPLLLWGTLFLSFVFPLQGGAAPPWIQQLNELGNSIANTKVATKSVYVDEIIDDSSYHYLPFTKKIRGELIRALQKSGVNVTSNPAVAEAYLYTNYYLSREALSLESRVKDTKGNQLSSGSVMINHNLLPKSWDRRTLRNVVHEIAGKLDRELYGQRIDTVLRGLTGGELDSDEFISDFTIIMNDYMRDELNKVPSVMVREAADSTRRSHRLKGKFKVVGERVYLNYSLVKEMDSQLVTTASTQFSIRAIPQGMTIYPENRNQVAGSFDEKKGVTEQIPIVVWVNHKDALYKNDDRLEVSVRPDVDAYVRVFYVQSDGMVCQIQPSSPRESSLLQAGMVYVIGGKDDDIELIITDSTTGQESIKVFASATPVDEADLPISFIESVNFSCMSSDYRTLKNMMTRGLKMNRTIQPMKEIQLLIR